MASKIAFVQPDPFKGVSNKVASYIPDYADQGSEAETNKSSAAMNNGFDSDHHLAARPINGIAVKPNTSAYVQVINADGEALRIFNQLTREPTLNLGETLLKHVDKFLGLDKDQAPKSTAWTDWILQGVREERIEKTQIVETFGETYLYAFGERPRSLVFTGLLMNTLDFNWRAVFWENWDKYFRATRLIEENARIYISFDDIIVEGYPLNAVASQTSDSPNALSFSFNFFVTNYTSLAAHRNFKYLGKDSLAVVRAGYQTGVDEIKSSKISIVELLGFQGAAKAGNFIHKEMIEAGFSSTQALVAGRAVGDMANLVSQSAFTAISGPANTRAFINAFLTKTAMEVFKSTSALAVDAIEKKGNLKRGEVNAWFGLLGTVLTSLDNNPALDALDLGSDGLELLKLGSIDRIVQAMAYNVGGFLSPAKPTEETKVLALKLPTRKPSAMAVVDV